MVSNDVVFKTTSDNLRYNPRTLTDANPSPGVSYRYDTVAAAAVVVFRSSIVALQSRISEAFQ